jgi:chromosome segregation ATPase
LDKILREEREFTENLITDNNATINRLKQEKEELQDEIKTKERKYEEELREKRKSWRRKKENLQDKIHELTVMLAKSSHDFGNKLEEFQKNFDGKEQEEVKKILGEVNELKKEVNERQKDISILESNLETYQKQKQDEDKLGEELLQNLKELVKKKEEFQKVTLENSEDDLFKFIYNTCSENFKEDNNYLDEAAISKVYGTLETEFYKRFVEEEDESAFPNLKD